MTVVITHFPSPYQVELFNEIDRQRPHSLKVMYLFRRDPARSWTGVQVSHAHSYVDEWSVSSVASEVEGAEFVVFNFFNDRRATQLIRARERTGKPWCFWGERPGYRYSWLARLNRLGRLGPLRNGRQPIWGIGSWAVDAYRQEFGESRPYLNLPYYSNLGRFQQARPAYDRDRFTFLFSGAVTHRKGIDVLAAAFKRLAAESPRVRLTIMGEGDLAPQVKQSLAGVESISWTGFKDWNQLPEVYGSAHALCVPSRHDGWALVVPEGLASSLPVIATDRTGAAIDLVRNGHNGWVTAAGDADALYGAMRDAAALTETKWQAMSHQARTSINGHSLADGARRFLEGVEAAVEHAKVIS